MSAISWSAIWPESACSPAIHRSFSRRWKPVNATPGSRSSSSRPSILGSMSPNDSATGSIRSQ